jgi:hypothetical protein
VEKVLLIFITGVLYGIKEKHPSTDFICNQQTALDKTALKTIFKSNREIIAPSYA